MNSEPSSKKLETAHYFDELEARIVQRLHAEAKSDESRAELLRNTGVEDPQLLDELSRL